MASHLFMTKREKKVKSSGDPAVDAYLKKLEESILRERQLLEHAEDETPPKPVQRPAPRSTAQPAPAAAQQPAEPTPPAVKAPPPPAASPRPPAAQAPDQNAPSASTPSPQDGDQRQALFQQGDILKMDDGTLAVYQGPVKGKEYDMTLFLNPDGRVEPRGVMIYAYDCEKIGHLPPLYFEKLRHLMAWNRDLIVFHLDRYEWCKHVPFPTNPALHRAPDKTPLPHRTPLPPRQHRPGETDRIERSASPSQSRPEQMLQKGRRIAFKMGANEWHAVYWGRDELGHLVAHQTHGEWALLHLDLERFGSAIQYNGLLGPDELREMEQSILKKYAE
ncbi:MAG: hypothetical protein Kow0059_20310 [Candidatus Sumerlaeia bacterium]